MRFLTAGLAFLVLFLSNADAKGSARAATPHSAKAPKAALKTPKAKKPAIRRSVKARDEFQKANPCPSTGRASGGCKGYVIDHRTPLACGGADAPSNMQWQTVAAAKAKDRVERAGCSP